MNEDGRRNKSDNNHYEVREYSERYDVHNLERAIGLLARGTVARHARSRELRGAIEKLNGRKHASERVWLTLQLKRIRRCELCMEFMRLLMTKLRRSDCNDRASRLRAQRIRYYRKKIDVPERLSDTLTINRQIQYGRRIAGCVDTLFLRNTVACDDEEDEVRTLSLQGAPKEVRGVLCGGIYHDIDMENCFPNIAIFLGERYGYNFPVLTRYTQSKDSREELLQEIIDKHKLLDYFTQASEARDKAKRLPLMLLHGGTYYGWTKIWKLPHEERVDSMRLLANEMIELNRGAARSERPIERAIYGNRTAFQKLTGKSDDAVADGKRLTQLERSLIATVLQTYENRILEIIVQLADLQGWVVGSLQYDGLFIEHRDDASIDKFMRAAEAQIAECMRESDGKTLAIRLEEKELYNKRPEPILREWSEMPNQHLARIKKATACL